MNRIEEILLNARDTLNDHAKERWSDVELIRKLDEGQKDIATQTEIFKDIIVLPLKTGEHTYRLPEDTISVLRITQNGGELPLKTTNYMDTRGLTGRLLSNITNRPNSTYLSNSLSSYWTAALTDSQLIYCVYDKIKRQTLRVWPTPVGSDLEESVIEVDQDYGIIVDIASFNMVGNAGLVSSVIDTSEIITEYSPSLFGSLVDLIRRKSIVIYRSKTSATVRAVTDELEVDMCWDTALKHYVVGKTFRNDINASNRQIGNEELTFYNRELERLHKVSSQSSVSGDHFDSRYDGMGG